MNLDGHPFEASSKKLGRGGKQRGRRRRLSRETKSSHRMYVSGGVLPTFISLVARRGTEESESPCGFAHQEL